MSCPMVRSGELPIRLLSLRYGCDLLWTPELVDKNLTIDSNHQSRIKYH